MFVVDATILSRRNMYRTGCRAKMPRNVRVPATPIYKTLSVKDGPGEDYSNLSYQVPDSPPPSCMVVCLNDVSRREESRDQVLHSRKQINKLYDLQDVLPVAIEGLKSSTIGVRLKRSSFVPLKLDQSARAQAWSGPQVLLLGPGGPHVKLKSRFTRCCGNPLIGTHGDSRTIALFVTLPLSLYISITPEILRSL
ncbi:hypothetical protein PoB_006608300 [Plakobranchus ocellatus]|uniref:Uncharacterized protein n=1 Tax=Plakobranchus ocellatus TaxID=259542 RepID=A0AAV4D693_9GAST|nr:hypothetical protein PoB_006608300 [Plakobranchus ocellatus]